MGVRHTLFALMLAWTGLAMVPQVYQAQEPAEKTSPFLDGTDTSLGRQVRDLLRDPHVATAHWGIAVTELDGTPVFGLDAGKLFRPASTAKLFTTAAAMALLGPEHRFTTRVYGDLDPTTGTVRGDLTLEGGGDPSFGTDDLPYTQHPQGDPANSEAPAHASLQELAQNLTKAGVKQITGNVVGDDTLFEPATVPQGWAEEDLLWGYGALPNALAIGDNQLRLTVTPKSADPASGPPAAPPGALTATDQLYPYLTLTNDVTTAAPASQQSSSVDVQRLPGTRENVRVFGKIAPGTTPVSEHLALGDPATYAAGAFRAVLQGSGVLVQGTAVAVHRPATAEPIPFLAGLRAPGCEANLWGEGPGCAPSCANTPHPGHLLAEHLSPLLAQDIVFTLKTSANLHAEMLLHHLGLRLACPGVTTLQGARVLRVWLRHIGLLEEDFLLYDGSGLSTKDLVTPRAEAQLLAYAATQPWFSKWFAALPVGGTDGTLSARFAELPLKGNVNAKTGTLGETRALAGYVRCASGKQLIVSVLVDNHEPGSAADRIVMDKIVAAIYRDN